MCAQDLYAVAAVCAPTAPGADIDGSKSLARVASTDDVFAPQLAGGLSGTTSGTASGVTTPTAHGSEAGTASTGSSSGALGRSPPAAAAWDLPTCRPGR